MNTGIFTNSSVPCGGLSETYRKMQSTTTNSSLSGLIYLHRAPALFKACLRVQHVLVVVDDDVAERHHVARQIVGAPVLVLLAANSPQVMQSVHPGLQSRLRCKNCSNRWFYSDFEAGYSNHGRCSDLQFSHKLDAISVLTVRVQGCGFKWRLRFGIWRTALQIRYPLYRVPHGTY